MKKTAAYLWHHLEEIILLPSLAFSVVLLFIQIICRYVFHNSLSWSEELARYLFVWQCWLGISYSAKKGTHLRITVIHKLFGKTGRDVLEMLILLVWMGFCVYLMYRGFELTAMTARYGQVSTAMRLPMQYCYAAIPVGAGLMLIRLIEKAVNTWRPKNGEEATAK